MHQHTNRRLIAAFLVSFVVAAETCRAADKQPSVESVPADVKRAIASEMRELEIFTRSGVKADTDFVRPLAQCPFSHRIRAWLDAANGGLADGQFLCGVCQRDGIGTRINATAAAQWFRKAAEQGHARAQVALGNAFYYGNGVAKNAAEAVRWFRNAVDQGDVGAQVNLGVCYANGAGVVKNAAEAVRWYKKAAEQGYAIAQYNLGLCYANGDGVEKDTAEAVRWGKKAAEQGYAEAQYNLVLCYANGDGVEKDTAEAVRWLRKAADQGHARAQEALARAFYYGTGIEKDTAEAVRWWKKAGEQNNARAQYMLGLHYAVGDSDEKNLAVACHWLRKAADQGHAGAQWGLGMCYMKGNGVQKNAAEAIRWWKKAADQGYAEAQADIGVWYAIGDGVKRNPVEAVRWYKKAAQQSYARAQYNLGDCYYVGDGVEKNAAEAVRWYQKAAEQGLAESHNNLGLCYEKGTGVVQNNAQACVHYLIANALNGADYEQNNLQIIRASLSGAQYAAAQQTATQWVEKFRAGERQTPDAAPTAPTPSDTVKATGSGFVISTDGYFLTCAHVIEDGREIKVRIGDKTHPAKVVRADKRNDVALLKLEGEGFTPLALAQSVPEMGDKVFTIGYPNPGIQGSAAKYTDGAVSALSGLQDDVRTMQITASIQGGNSGGVLADSAGNAVGLVVAQLNAVTVFEYTGSIPQNVNFAVKINYALPLIQAVPNLARRLPPPTKPVPNVSPVKTVEAATGLVIVHE